MQLTPEQLEQQIADDLTCAKYSVVNPVELFYMLRDNPGFNFFESQETRGRLVEAYLDTRNKPLHCILDTKGRFITCCHEFHVRPHNAANKRKETT